MSERGLIDLHAHVLTPAYVRALDDAGYQLPGGSPPDWSPELAIGFMEAHGIERQLLSVSDPGVAFLPAAEQAALATTLNDEAAAVVHAHPDRFAALAVLPLGDPPAAALEAIRALDRAGLAGVGLLSNSERRYPGDPVFEPLLSELDQRGAWAFIHPTVLSPEQRPSYWAPGFVAEFPFETTRAFISLFISGAFERYPRIRWQFAHGGGTLVMHTARLRTLVALAPQFGASIGLPDGARQLTSTSVNTAIERCMFDTALVGDQSGLRALDALCGGARIAFGSDWPFAARTYGPSGDPQPGLRDVFDADALAAIRWQNAEREHPTLSQATRPVE